MEAAWPSKMLLSYHLTIWCHNPKDHNLHFQEVTQTIIYETVSGPVTITNANAITVQDVHSDACYHCQLHLPICTHPLIQLPFHHQVV